MLFTIYRFQKIRKKYECHENNYYESPQQKYREKQNQRLRKECLREDLLISGGVSVGFPGLFQVQLHFLLWGSMRNTTVLK